MRVLITGAAGFVGNPLCQTLAAQGIDVIKGVRQLSNTGIQDACRPVDLAGATDCADIDAIVHLAARVHVMHDAVADPLAEFRKVNVEGTLNLARQAAAARVKRFVYISSIKVNGEWSYPQKPFTAADLPAPADAYGLSKYEAEQGLWALAKTTGMEIVVIRPPLIYGPGVKANFLSMMRLLVKSIPLPFAGIRNKRSLLALDNLIDFIIVSLHHPKAANRTFLVADGCDLSTTELLFLLGEALRKPARLFYIPARVMKAAAVITGKKSIFDRLYGNLQIDSKEACAILNWQPPMSVDEGLKITSAHFLKTYVS
jgi:nucleoside-diphosphate-sugar epimerase